MITWALPLLLLSIPVSAGVLLLLYRRRSLPRRLVVPSLLLLRELPQPPTPSARRSIPWRFFVDLLLLSLLAIAAAGPLLSSPGERVAILIDNSFRSFAEIGGRSYVEAALDEARAEIRRQGELATVEIWVTSPRVALLGDRPLSAREARNMLTTIAPTYAHADLNVAVATVRERSESKRLIVLVGGEVRASSGVEVRSVAPPVSNRVMSEFQVVPTSDGGARASGVIRFFGSASTTDTPIVVRAWREGGGVEVARVFPTIVSRDGASFEVLLPSSQDVLFQAEFGVRDEIGIDEDDRRLAWRRLSGETLPAVSSVLTFPHPAGAVTLISPSSPEETPVVLHRLAVADVPRTPILLISSSIAGGIDVVPQDAPQRIVKIRSETSLLRHLTPGTLPEPRAVLALDPSWSSVVDSVSGSLLAIRYVDGALQVATTFELLPFRGATTVPESILLLNILAELRADPGRGGVRPLYSTVADDVLSIISFDGKRHQFLRGEVVTLPGVLEHGGNFSGEITFSPLPSADTFTPLPEIIVEPLSAGGAVTSGTNLVTWILAAFAALVALDLALHARRRRAA